MTPALLIARDCSIYWLNVWIAPVECVFDVIETELARRDGPAKSTASRTRRETTTGVLTC